MTPTRIPATAFAYPAIFLHRTGFEVWLDSKACSTVLEARPDPGRAIGVLVDNEGRAHRVLDAEDPWRPNGRLPTREEFRALSKLEDRSVILICDQDSTTIGVDELRDRVAWAVSAARHFESPNGFGLPRTFEDAKTITDLLKVLVANGFARVIRIV